MKLAVVALAALILGGCARESRSPVDPTPDPVAPATAPPADPTPATNGWLWAMAVRDDLCIPGATFTVVSGQLFVGELITQRTPCSVWDDPPMGIWLSGLTPGAAMTLRASAAGYRDVERTVLAKTAGFVEQFVLE